MTKGIYLHQAKRAPRHSAGGPLWKLHKSYRRLAKSLVAWVCTKTTGDSVSTDPIVLPNRQKLNWLTTMVLILLHIGAVAALFMFSWRVLAITAFLYWMT